MQQLDEHVQYVRRTFPDDVCLLVAIIARAERLFTSYVDEQFDDLVPLRDELRKLLHARWRMERRRCIRIALTYPERSYEKSLKLVLNENRWGKPSDIKEDFEAAERSVREGTRLLEGLTLTPPPPNG
jgi:hypothetical protein